MADFRPFRALRYRPEAVEDMAAVLSPPYDVIDAAAQSELHERSPYNVIRLELADTMPDDNEEWNRYTRAAAALQKWRAADVLAKDGEPAFYVYMLEFTHEGRRYRRTHYFGLLRLEPWEKGSVRPHEETMAHPKEDRLQLMRHLHANVSPVFVVRWADPRKRDRVLPPAGIPLVDVTTPDGQRHMLNVINQREVAGAITTGLQKEPLYILDGHHRYETALAYRDEVAARAENWTGEEPENFVLAAMTTADDPGLLCLPTHRLVRPPAQRANVIESLSRFFQVDDTTPKSYDGTALHRLLARVAAAGNTRTPAFGALGLDEGRLHLLTLRDAHAVRALMPKRSATWQSLDVNVLDYAVLREALGVEPGMSNAIDYTQDPARAMQEVESGRWPLAFLLNATKVEQVIAVADAREKMPAKSTYFYPKLPTGLVLHAFDE